MTLHRLLLLAGAALFAGSLAADPMGLPDLPGGTDAYASPSGGQDLVKLQARMDELLAQAKATKESADRLDNVVNRLLNSTGVRFGGEAVAHSISLGVFPTKGTPAIAGLGTTLTQPRRAWPSVGYLDFRVTARPRAELSGEMVYRMEKIFGGYWGSLDISGVRWFNIHGDTAIGFDLGQFKYKHTPLTVWAPEDEHPGEIKILANKRKLGMDQVYLGDNAWPLQGARLDATIIFFSHIDLALEAIGVRTAIAGTKNTGLPFAVIFPYDQYLVGGSATLGITGSDIFHQGFSYYEIMESKDTSVTPPISPEMRSDLVATDSTLELAGKRVIIQAEYAVSNYTPAYANTTYTAWTVGTAARGSLKLKGEHHDIKLYGQAVDEKFINYAAQTRTHASTYDTFYDFPTGNNLLDPHEGDYGLTSVNNLYFTRYNPVIFATNQGRSMAVGTPTYQQAGIYAPAGILNRSLPNGIATPNRVGGGADLEFNMLRKTITLDARGSVFAEPQKAYYMPTVVGQRAYTRAGGGLTIDLAPLTGLPLSISQSWNMEDVRAVTVVAYTTQRGDVNIHWQVFKGVHLITGWQQVAVWGSDYEFSFLGATPPTTPIKVDFVATMLTGGLLWELSKATDFGLTYTHGDFWYPSATTDFGYEEFEARLALRF